MALRQSDMLHGIETMAIYRKDYDNIKLLLDTNDEKLIIRILEEVLSGNLLWSDLDKILSNTKYPEFLEETLEQQEKIKQEIQRLVDFRNSFSKPEEPSTVISATNLNIGFVRNGYVLDENGKIDEAASARNNEFFENEYSRIQENMLYEITKPNKNDNILSIQVKNELKRNIQNGKLLILDIKNKLADDEGYIYRLVNAGEGSYNRESGTNKFTPSSTGNYNRIYKYDEKKIYSVNADNTLTEIAPYINPSDIFFFINSFIIPAKYEYQTLNQMDRIFMAENNMTEEMMLKFKAASLWMRQIGG